MTNKISWTNDYEIGVEEIDFQHHYFSLLINRLMDELSGPIKSVFIATEQPEGQCLLSEILAPLGHDIQRIPLAGNAYATLKEISPALVVLDIETSNALGLQLCNRLKSDDDAGDVPVIFASTLSEIHDKKKAFEAGCFDYITKPFSAEEVLARVKNCLMMRHYQSRLENTLRERTDDLTHEKEKAELELKRDFFMPLSATPNWPGTIRSSMGS